MLTFPVFLLLFVLLFLVSALYLEWFRPTVTFFIAVLLLVLGGILTPAEALQGFANEQLAVIILLLVISDIFRKSSIINVIFNRFFGQKKTLKGFSTRMMMIVSVFSSFFNNTPIVAMMMPYVNKWGNTNNISPSKLLMPLSFATILGGCITLIGTSTNLVVNGLAVDAGFEPLGIFDFTLVGLPMLIIGILYLIFFGIKMLPDYKDHMQNLHSQSREYFIETAVLEGSPLIGKSVENAQLRNLKGLYLVEIIRDGRVITPVGPEELLENNDILIFAGDTASIDELSRIEMGLSFPKSCESLVKEKTGVNEVVISYNSGLIGKRVKDTNFRAKFDGAIVAIHRNGEKLGGKIGEVVLRAGDVLLVFSGSDFITRTRTNQSFYILSTVDNNEVNVTKITVLFTSLLAAIIVAAATNISLLICLSVVLLLAVFMKVVPMNDIRKGLDMDLILLIAFGLALGKAMINSGLAVFVADAILKINTFLNPFLLMMLLFIVTNIMAAYITNKAAVAIIFPISVAIAMELGLPTVPFILIVAFGAAANFITPIGYQTNLMVYGPGGYSFKDFMKIGMPLTIIYMIISSLILTYAYGMF